MNVMEQSVVTLLLLPRPWLSVDERQTRADEVLDAGDGRAPILGRAFRRGGKLYANGAVTGDDGRTVRRLAYWHQVVIVRDESTAES